jgi:exonuclease III
MSVPTEANADTHDSHGRCVLLEFSSLLALFRITHSQRVNNHLKKLARKADDKLVHEFVKNQATINNKPILYAGIFDVASNAEDMTEKPHWYAEYEDPASKVNLAPDDCDDSGLSPCTTNNCKAFKNLLRDGGLIDLGAGCDDIKPQHTLQCDGELSEHTLRTTYIAVSRSLVLAGCVVKCVTLDPDNECSHRGQC